MKALVGAFNQEKALVGAFSVIVKTNCGTDGSICGTNYSASLTSELQAKAGPQNLVCVNHSARLGWYSWAALGWVRASRGRSWHMYFWKVSCE